MEIDAASNRGIDEVRELREMVRYAPLTRKHRVVILDEAHMLTGEAANALLKTLEEPPEGVVFVLATTEPEKLPDTIRSRAQHFHFRALSFQEISAAIEKIAKQEGLTIEPGALAVIARAAEGSVRDGLSVLEQAMAFCGTTLTDSQVRELLGVVAEEALDELIAAIETQSAERALALVHRLIGEGQNLQHFCREAIRHFRNLLVARVCGAGSELIAAPQDERPRLAAQSAKFSEEDLTRYFQILLYVDDDLRRKPDQRLHAEIGLLRLVNAARLAPLEELLGEMAGNSKPSGEGARSAPAVKASVAGASALPKFEAPRAPAFSATPPQRAEPKKTFSTPATAAAAGPALAPPRAESAGPVAVPMPPPSAIAQAAGERSGITLAQEEAIKAAIAQQQKMLWTLIEPVSRWELEGGELRLYYPGDKRSLADILQTREPMEKLRSISSQVIGQPLRVCVKLDAARTAAPAVNRSANSDLRRQIEQDPIVREMLARFGGQISSVKRSDEG
jgi:DNA polymerase-3 subunit gamma/tau